MMRAFAFGAVLAAGCYQPAPQAGGPCSDRGTCPTPLACVAGSCVDPSTAPADAAIDACPELSCVGNDLAGCGSRITCSLGCADAVAPSPAHCRVMVPSNGLAVSMLTGATADVTGLDLDFDTETGEITFEGGMPLRAPGTGVIAGIGFEVRDRMGVFTAHSWNVPAFVTDSGDDWDAAGVNGLVLFAATTIHVDGRVDVGASGSGGGAGGAGGATTGSPGPTCRGKAGLWQSAGFGEGGGGGGGRAAGGNGAVSNTTTFGAGGPSCATGPTTIPLVGGNGGGAGGVETATSPDTVHGGAGGGGGGALALVAMESITISATGNACAPGEGGRTSATGDGGGGGGSGGAILLEAPVIDLTAGAVIAANGGGGAAPSTNNGTRGHPDDASPAEGGVFMTASGGRGGTGAPPHNGTTYADVGSARGGGGGGAGGRIELKARSRSTTGAVISPGAALTDIATE